jgi:hypothetical protein
MKGERLDLGDMPEIDVEQLKTVAGQLFGNESLHRLAKTKLAEAGFYDQLPATGQTQETFVTAIGNDSAGLVGKGGMVMLHDQHGGVNSEESSHVSLREKSGDY